jgi:hypothetical protein
MLKLDFFFTFIGTPRRSRINIEQDPAKLFFAVKRLRKLTKIDGLKRL